jgi:putative endonuclease
MPWTVYILKCADGTLYTGVTNDIVRRLAQHESGTGAKYTRGRGPLELLHAEQHRTKGRALKREAEIKSWRKEEKLALAAQKKPAEVRDRRRVSK